MSSGERDGVEKDEKKVEERRRNGERERISLSSGLLQVEREERRVEKMERVLLRVEECCDQEEMEIFLISKDHKDGTSL